jgi:nucleoid-associated protein YgaU
MRRNAVTLFASLFLLSAVTGCATLGKLFGKKTEPAADLAYDPAMDPAAPAETYPTYGGGFAATGGGKSHTVQKGDTLYKIARSYYNDQSRWKDIYAANRAEIGDPNQIRVGQRLSIP